MRRRVWDNILKLIKDDRSVLLTSHSMAECDALCSRLAIMVNGVFKCFGTTQHLKTRFGGGYTVQIKVLRENIINQIIEFMDQRFYNSYLKVKIVIIIYQLQISYLKIFCFSINRINMVTSWNSLFHVKVTA